MREEERRSVLFDFEASAKERWSEEPALAQDDVAVVLGICHLVFANGDWVRIGQYVGVDLLAHFLWESEER